MIQDLKIKGVHGDIIDSVVGAAYGEVNEEQLAREFLQRKRMGSPKDRSGVPGSFAPSCARDSAAGSFFAF